MYNIHVYFVILFSPLLCSTLLYYILPKSAPQSTTLLLYYYSTLLLPNLLYSTLLYSTLQSTLLDSALLCSTQVESTSIGWSLGYMLDMSNMIPSEVKKIPPMTDPVFAGLIFLFSALTIVTVVFVFIILIRTCY